jgi:predicted KAP-like P-loop ATPase
VLIDELDRVEDDEVRAVAQLVKAVGDIEGLAYLVAYDPDRVADALGRGEGIERQISGARYLEKIIQLPIPLRPLFDEDVEALLEAELTHHSVTFPTAGAENQQEVLAQIKREIATPRDIKRLVGAFAVLELATRGNRARRCAGLCLDTYQIARVTGRAGRSFRLSRCRPK